MNLNLIELTTKYVAAFNSKNAGAVEGLLHEDISLVDPGVNLRGRDSVMAMINDLFKQNGNFSFSANQIYQAADTTFIEFQLTLGDKAYAGVDVIDWEKDQIKDLRAYLYETFQD